MQMLLKTRLQNRPLFIYTGVISFYFFRLKIQYFQKKIILQF